MGCRSRGREGMGTFPVICICTIQDLMTFLSRLVSRLGGAMVLDNLSVPGRPSDLDNSRTRA